MSRVKSLFDFDDRGTIEVKNKGQLRMYYLTHIKPALSRDELGHVPNEAFHRESTKFPATSPPLKAIRAPECRLSGQRVRPHFRLKQAFLFVPKVAGNPLNNPPE
jgi:hypothetical protein